MWAGQSLNLVQTLREGHKQNAGVRFSAFPLANPHCSLAPSTKRGWHNTGSSVFGEVWGAGLCDGGKPIRRDSFRFCLAEMVSRKPNVGQRPGLWLRAFSGQRTHAPRPR